MSVIVNFALFPLDQGESVSPHVARAVRIIRESGLPYQLHSMGTCLEGDWGEVMAVVGRCVEDLEQDCGRIYVALTADYRKGAAGRMEAKVRAVERRL